MGSKPITNKASSACKINMGLVSGQADIANSKGFVDYSKLMEDKMNAGGGDTSSKEVIIEGKGKDKDNGKSPATKKLKGAQNILPQHLQDAIKAAPGKMSGPLKKGLL